MFKKKIVGRLYKKKEAQISCQPKDIICKLADMGTSFPICT